MPLSFSGSIYLFIIYKLYNMVYWYIYYESHYYTNFILPCSVLLSTLDNCEILKISKIYIHFIFVKVSIARPLDCDFIIIIAIFKKNLNQFVQINELLIYITFLQ